MSLPHSRILLPAWEYWGPGQVLFGAALVHRRGGYPSRYPGYGTSSVPYQPQRFGAWGNHAAFHSPVAWLCSASCSWVLVLASDILPHVPLKPQGAWIYKSEAMPFTTPWPLFLHLHQISNWWFQPLQGILPGWFEVLLCCQHPSHGMSGHLYQCCNKDRE